MWTHNKSFFIKGRIELNKNIHNKENNSCIKNCVPGSAIKNTESNLVNPFNG